MVVTRKEARAKRAHDLPKERAPGLLAWRRAERRVHVGRPLRDGGRDLGGRRRDRPDPRREIVNRRVAGLDEDLEGCPRLDVDTEGFIDAIDVDQTALVVNIAGDLFLRCDPWFWFIATVGTICAANDEFVGFHLQQYNHLTIVPGGDTFNAPLEGSENLWHLDGTLVVV